MTGESPAVPCRIEEAQGEVAGESFVNLLPVPLEQAEPFELELLAINGEEVSLSGPSASLVFLSRPAFIDLEANA